ncbi:PKD-like family lipoprotein [Chitinophaga rhizosphaerae]|uniref:PKD-like family lipoprotein n=1 Tax=Chitinophaga rhizosphaerae TaxID=1864947 RepID=UPI000F811D38|nr:PKD-like family lipoprotein [Chitinophaga rhizosphaerae]
MNWKYHSLAACCIVLLSACYKDKGNYIYEKREEITVSGIASTYDKVSLQDKITINPEVTSTDPGARFSYWWGIYETNVQGSAPKVDTIGREKALDYLVTQSAKGWVLVFGAKNEHTGVSRIVTSSINVTTRFTRGWYVLKDDGTGSDVDLFLTPENIEPASKLDNVFSLVNQRKIDGKSMLFAFYSNYKSNVTGVMSNTRALFMLTDKDASVVNINTFREIHGLGGLFYETVPVKKPGSICEANSSNFFVNDGQLHSLYGMSANVGLFGGRQLRDDVNTPYYLSKYFLAYVFGNPFFFDERSSSFVSATGTGSVMSNVTDAEGTEMPANRNNKELLYMGLKSTNPFSGVALFRDKTDPSLKILSTIKPENYSLKLVNDTLDAAEQIYRAERFGSVIADENILYFSVGDKIWSRNLSNGVEQLQSTLDGEQITFIRHLKYSGSGAEQPFSFNYVLVGTTAGGSYKVRAFRKSSGNLATAPDFVMEGAGSAGDVIYMAPPVSNYTYSNTY